MFTLEIVNMEPWSLEDDNEITGPGGNGGGSAPVAFVSFTFSAEIAMLQLYTLYE